MKKLLLPFWSVLALPLLGLQCSGATRANWADANAAKWPLDGRDHLGSVVAGWCAWTRLQQVAGRSAAGAVDVREMRSELAALRQFYSGLPDQSGALNLSAMVRRHDPVSDASVQAALALADQALEDCVSRAEHGLGRCADGARLQRLHDTLRELFIRLAASARVVVAVSG